MHVTWIKVSTSQYPVVDCCSNQQAILVFIVYRAEPNGRRRGFYSTYVNN